MANPQKENGYTGIANEIWDALWLAGLNGTEWEVITIVIRKTYGFRKKEDWISYTQFEKMTGKSRPAVWKAITSLVNKRLLVNNCKPGMTLYRFNKDYSGWVVNKRKLVNKQKSTSKQIEMEVVNNRLLTKETIQKKTTKEIDTKVSTTKVDYRNPEISQMLEALKKHVGVDSFVDSRIERNIARHCISLMQKIGPEEFRRRLDFLLDDAFMAKNCNKIKYVYNNIKGFREPKNNTVTIQT